MTSVVTAQPGKERKLVGRSSILILGGVLVGITTSEAMHDGMNGLQFYAFLSAIIGLLAFVGLDAVNRRRLFCAQRRAERESEARMERRVQRHLRDETA